MMQRVLVRVVGFTAVERHALNTVFRLSQDRQSAREWSYEPWTDGAQTAPRLALIDGSSPDASEALAEIEALGGVGIIWVGSISPAKAWKAYQRPMAWPAILASMDEYFTPHSQLDVDFGDDTWPSVLESTGAHMFPDQDLRRALIADADHATRMYLRTKLASFGITNVDEATSFLEARDFLSMDRAKPTSYDIVVVDLDLPGGDPWTIFGAARNPRLKLVTQARLSLASRMTAKVNSCASMGKPLDPARLNELFNKNGA